MARIVVLGGGFGGLAAAARLVRLGHDVTVLEPGPALGRPLAAADRDGTSTDAGTTSTTLPAVVRDLFHKAGAPDAVELVPLDPTVRIAVRGAAPLDLPAASRAGAARAITEAYGERAAGGWSAFVDHGRTAWRALHQQLLVPDREALPRWAWRRRRELTAPLDRLLDRTLPAEDAGSAPLRAYARHLAVAARLPVDHLPASAAALTYLEDTFGVWRVVGGMHRVTAALVELVVGRGRGAVLTGVEPADVARRLEAADAVVTDASPPPPATTLLELRADDAADTAHERTVLQPGLELFRAGATTWLVHGGGAEALAQQGVDVRSRLRSEEELAPGGAAYDHHDPPGRTLVVTPSPALGADLPVLGTAAARVATRIGRA